jgi:hypothetical protein
VYVYQNDPVKNLAYIVGNVLIRLGENERDQKGINVGGTEQPFRLYHIPQYTTGHKKIIVISEHWPLIIGQMIPGMTE